MLKRSVAYISGGSLVDLVLAIVLGIALWTLVEALSTAIITPFLLAITDGREMISLSFTVDRVRIGYGFALPALVSFLVVVALVLLALRPIARVVERQRQVDLSHQKACTECLSEIPLAARRCACCTSVQPDL